MTKTDWKSDVVLTSDPNSDAQERPSPRDPDQPFGIVILGDFTGASVGDEAAHGLTAHVIDIDNFDAVLVHCAPRWRGSLSDLPDHTDAQVAVEIVFRSIDDFHPDHLVRQVPALRALFETREGLADPQRFERIAAEIASWARVDAPHTNVPPSRGRPAALAPDDPSDLLNQILADAADEPSVAPVRSDDLQRFVESVVGPHVISTDRARQADYVALLDRLLTQHLRAILHDPAFQSLEAGWRGLQWLVRRIGGESQVKVQIVPLARPQLADAAGGAAAGESPLGNVVRAPGQVPPALLLGNFAFSAATDDVAVLHHLATIARSVRAPFIAAAAPALLGCESFADMPAARDLTQHFAAPHHEEWRALRRSPEACWLALALPRLLGRLPYGARTEPIEAFNFEEIEVVAEGAPLLWINPVFGVAAVATAGFADQRWAMDLASVVQQIDALPLYVYDHDGAAVTQPCAEVLLTDSQIEELGRCGLLPMVSLRNSDAIVLPCVQTLAEPRRALSWTS